MAIEDQSNFEFSEEFDVFLSVFLREVLPFEHMSQD